MPDADKPGREHADLVAASLQDVAASVRVLELPGLAEKEDVIDWAMAGGTVEKLHALIERSVEADRVTNGGESEEQTPASRATIRIVKGQIARMTDEAEAALIAAADAAPNPTGRAHEKWRGAHCASQCTGARSCQGVAVIISSNLRSRASRRRRETATTALPSPRQFDLHLARAPDPWRRLHRSRHRRPRSRTAAARDAIVLFRLNRFGGASVINGHFRVSPLGTYPLF
jgi:hypothetical protein